MILRALASKRLILDQNDDILEKTKVSFIAEGIPQLYTNREK